MRGSSSRLIFLSYRREDTARYANVLESQLERIPDTRVFMDLNSIEAGLDFTEVILEAVNSCTVLVALIGRQWVTIADEEGRRRLDNPDDYVRLELQTALDRGVRVIPVLVDEARPPRPEQLPPGLQELARLNAFELWIRDGDLDVDPLLFLIHNILKSKTRRIRHDEINPPLGMMKVGMAEPIELIPEENRVIPRFLRRFRDTK